MSASTSKIFKYGGEVGQFCGSRPPAFRFSAKKRLSILICPLGRCFRLYNVGRGLRFMSQSNQLDGDIRVLAADPVRVFAATKDAVYSFHLSKQAENTYRTDSSAPVQLLLPFGQHLLAVDQRNVLTIWDIATAEVTGVFEFDPDTFAITALLHPITYVNKVLLGSAQGALRIMNTKTARVVYTFAGWGSKVAALAQSPAVDIVAVGLESGDIYVHDIKTDETVLKLTQDFGPVSHMAFRSDGFQTLISGSPSCDLSFWDLDKRKLVHQIPAAHGSEVRSALTSLFVMPNEPVFITTSDNNSMRSWIFDQPDDGPRLYHSLQGHPTPPTLVRYHGGAGELILTSGAEDCTVKLFSTSKLTKYYNLGTAAVVTKKVAKKRSLTWDEVRLPPITQVASDSARESGWDNVVCCHKDDVRVSTWTTRKLRRGSHLLVHERFLSDPNMAKVVATCCCVTACGNFTLIGYSSGHVDMYNIQSGFHRGSLVDGKTEQNATAHGRRIVGVATDALNASAVTAAEDGLLKFWNFVGKHKKLKHALNLDSIPSILRIHRDSRLIAIATTDLAVLLIEISSREIVRRFTNAHQARITDLCFSASGYWLLTSGADCCVKTWDIPSGALVDALVTPNPCTSVAMSPVDNVLATTHTGQKGVSLWINRTLFHHVSLKPIDEEVFEEEGMEVDLQPMDVESRKEWKSKDQIGDLVTLSGLPETRWANLMFLDVIRQRNKPKEPPKKPKAAPFFLPTVAGLNPAFDIPEEKQDPSSKVLALSADGFRSELCKALARESQKEQPDFHVPFDLLKSWGPSRIESEIQSLGPLNGGSLPMTHLFLRMILQLLGERRDFDLVQSYLSVALKAHRDLLNSDPGVRECLQRIRDLSSASWDGVEESFDSCLTLIQYFKSAVL